jgi:formylglycine-generating enzyme required for sulfatase activity
VIPLVEDVDQELQRPRYSLPPGDPTEETSLTGDPPALPHDAALADEPHRLGRAPVTPLPRMWKAALEEPADDVPRKKTKGSPDGKLPQSERRKAAQDEAEPTPLDETPALDTYEGRKTARIIVGSVIGGSLLLVGLILYNLFSPAGPARTDAPVDEALLWRQLQQKAVDQAARNRQTELEALGMFNRAREFAQKGNTDMAIAMLTKVTTSYPGTRAAKEAHEALERPGQNLPLFLDRTTVVASKPTPPLAGTTGAPETNPFPAPKVVHANPVSAPVGAHSDAQLVLPANPAETGAPATPRLKTADRPALPLPSGFRPRQDAHGEVHIHTSGWPLEIVGDRDGAIMVLVPGGTFTMGRDGGDPTEAPTHRVILSTYYIDQHEVTVRQYNLFRKETHHAAPPTSKADNVNIAQEDKELQENLPVVMVSANDALKYAEWAGKSLPTEAQWELAARGTDGRLYPWGDTPPAWERHRTPRQIDPVQTFSQDVSPFGAADMAGNAWEWTKDWFDSRYYHLFRDQEANNPTGPAQRPRTHQLAVRGGSKLWYVTFREGLRYESKLAYVGFRCVLPVEGAGKAPGPGQRSVVIPF